MGNLDPRAEALSRHDGELRAARSRVPPDSFEGGECGRATCTAAPQTQRLIRASRLLRRYEFSPQPTLLRRIDGSGCRPVIVVREPRFHGDRAISPVAVVPPSRKISECTPRD